MRSLIFLFTTFIFIQSGISQSIDYKFLEKEYEEREYEKCLKKSEKEINKGTQDALPYFFKALSLANLLRDKDIAGKYIDVHRECLSALKTAKSNSENYEVFTAYKRDLDKLQQKIVLHSQKIFRKGLQNESEVYLKLLKEIFDDKSPFFFVLHHTVQEFYIDQFNYYLGQGNFNKSKEMLTKFKEHCGDSALIKYYPELTTVFKDQSHAAYLAGDKQKGDRFFAEYTKYSNLQNTASSGKLVLMPEFEEWKDIDIDAANTAANEAYLTDLEKKVIYYLNLARLHPQLFKKTYLDAYIKSLFEDESTIKIKGKKYDYNTLIKKEFYVSSLYKTLQKMKPVKALVPDKELYLFALCWAKEAGELGVVGHNRRQCAKGNFAECCQYGYEDALMIVLDLLIDRDIPSLGHREIMLDDYSKLGVSVQYHKKYDVNAVLDFY